MKKPIIQICFLSFFLLLGIRAVSEPVIHPNFELAKRNVEYLKISAFVPAGQVAEYMGDEENLSKAVEILSALGVTKVFLDVYRGGFSPDRKTLEGARDYLRAHGFEVAGGITTVSGPGFGVASPTHKYYLCYDNDVTKKAIEGISKYAASMFDEIIVDDFLATDCRCPECAVSKGDREWTQYFRDVMVGISRDQIVAAAKAENHNAKVTIKYPQWYDRFHMFGYDPGRQPAIFDKVWAGTETRDPLVENVQQYQAYNNYTWVSSLAGEKMSGAWFDQINTYPEVYVEQAYQSILAGAPEITLFGYNPKEFTSANTKLFSEKLEKFFLTAKVLKGKKRGGIAAYKPVNSDGGSENYVFDYLGMFGIPLRLTAKFPDDEGAVILTEHAAADHDIVDKIMKMVAKGGLVIMSAGLVEKLNDDKEILSLAGLLPPGAKTMKGKSANVFVAGGMETKSTGWVEIGEKLRVGDADILVSAKTADTEYPVLTGKCKKSKDYKGCIVVLNARTFSYFPGSTDVVIPSPVSYINSPEVFTAFLRNIVFSFRQEYQIMSMPEKVSYYEIGDYLALENFNDEEITVEIVNNPDLKPKGLKNVYTGEITSIVASQILEKGIGTSKIKVPKRDLSLFEYVYE